MDGRYSRLVRARKDVDFKKSGYHRSHFRTLFMLTETLVEDAYRVRRQVDDLVSVAPRRSKAYGDLDEADRVMSRIDKDIGTLMSAVKRARESYDEDERNGLG